MTVEPVVGPGTPADAAVIADLITKAFAVYRGRLDPEPSALRETPATIAAALALQRAAIARLGDQPAGCVLYRPEGSDGFYLGRLAVLPALQRRGIALALIAFVEAEARAARAVSISLNVRIALTGNQQLFATAGYREVARHAHPGYSAPTFIEMRKRL